MGASRNYQLEKFAAETGIKPATGERLDLLNRLSKLAYEAIQIVELERSGIRDGDGLWGGGDVIGGMFSDLRRCVDSLERSYEEEFRRSSQAEADERQRRVPIS